MNKSSIEKLYGLYKLLVLKFKIKIETTNDFKKLIYELDKYWLASYIRPFLWEEYLFIDDTLLNFFKIELQKSDIFKKIQNYAYFDWSDTIEFDELCEFDIRTVQKILDGELKEDVESGIHFTDNGEIDTIDHLKFISSANGDIVKDRHQWYFESREMFFWSKYSGKEGYPKYLQELRNRKINNILKFG